MAHIIGYSNFAWFCRNTKNYFPYWTNEGMHTWPILEIGFVCISLDVKDNSFYFLKTITMCIDRNSSWIVTSWKKNILQCLRSLYLHMFHNKKFTGSWYDSLKSRFQIRLARPYFLGCQGAKWNNSMQWEFATCLA